MLKSEKHSNLADTLYPVGMRVHGILIHCAVYGRWHCVYSYPYSIPYPWPKCHKICKSLYILLYKVLCTYLGRITLIWRLQKSKWPWNRIEIMPLKFGEQKKFGNFVNSVAYTQFDWNRFNYDRPQLNN